MVEDWSATGASGMADKHQSSNPHAAVRAHNCASRRASSCQRGRASVGAELRGERVWSGGARLRTSYSYQNAENVGTWLVNSPRHLAKFNVMAPFAPGWHAGFELHYISERSTPQGNTINDYRVANLTLRADRLVADLDISASIYNLFGSAYADPPSEEHADDLGRNLTAIAQNGRNYRIKLNYRF